MDLRKHKYRVGTLDTERVQQIRQTNTVAVNGQIAGKENLTAATVNNYTLLNLFPTRIKFKGVKEFLVTSLTIFFLTVINIITYYEPT